MTKLYILFLFLFITTLNADVKHKKNILILHSYTQDYQWTKNQHEAFITSLKQSDSFTSNISTEYLDTKRVVFNDDYQSFFLSYLQKKYNKYQPDVIYVTDDDAFNFILKFHPVFHPEIPVFFSGVNDLSSSTTIDHDKVTGVYEKKEIIPNIDLIKQFSPQTRDIWIVGDNSTTYKLIEKELKENIANYSNFDFHFIASSKIDDVYKSLPVSKKSFVLLTTVGSFTDRSGANISIEDSIELLAHNKNIILCSMEDAYIQGGVIGGYVTSGQEQGEKAASLALQYFNGTALKNLKPVLASPNVYIFDRAALNRSRLILSEYIARDAVILHENVSFFEKHKSIILNSLFITVIVVFIFFIVIYFVAAEKRRYLLQLSSDYEILKKINETEHMILSLTESSFNIGYWTYNLENMSCFISNGLIEMCYLDESIEHTIDSVLSIAGQESDKLKKAIDDTFDMSYSHRLHHRIFSGDGSIRESHHVIHPLTITNGVVKQIVGIVRIKND